MLHAVIFLPLLAALALLAVRKDNVRVVKRVAVLALVVDFALALALAAGFTRSGPDGLSHAWSHAWLPSLGAHYAVGIDGVSLCLILLTTILGPITLLASFSSIHDRLRDFVFWFLALQTFMLGVVSARDLFLFFIFWELLLVPMLMIIGRWGGERRIYAAIKFFVYTMVGSLPMLAALVYLESRYTALFPTAAPSFLFADLLKLSLSAREQLWLFIGFAGSFAIKLPLFPLHTWLPDAHTEAPTPGSMVLAGVLLKMGGYGFLAIAMVFFPLGAIAAQPVILTLSTVGVIYGALVAMVQPDLKKLVAYSSVSHMAMVTLGFFALNVIGLTGGIVTMIAHGFSTGALFLLVGMIYERRHTRLIAEFGGIAKKMPVFATAFVLVTFSSIGLPTLNGFIGEVLILLGTFQAAPIYACFAVTGAILGAWYMLSAVKRVFFGPITNPANEKLEDLTVRERWLIAPLAAVIVVTGLIPTPITDLVKPDVERIVRIVNAAAAGPAAPPESRGR